MRIEAGVATDIGKVREANEDSYLARSPLFAVADGMGGHRGGEVASQLALEVIEELSAGGEGTLGEQVRQANKAVFERSQADSKVTGMGTTLTVALVEGGAVKLAHVGDSRAYLLRAGSFRQLTDDHTLVAKMVKTGEITAEEAEIHPHRNVLTRALGTEPSVKVDEKEVPLMAGDRLLLCSDGLTSMLTEEQIQAILGSAGQPQDAANRLVRAANRAGGVDNVTVVVLDVSDDPTGSDDDTASDKAPSALRPSRRSIKRWLLGLGIAVIFIAAGTFLTHAYLERQWYVGTAGGHVSVYEGIPATPLGIHLSHVVYESSVPAQQAQSLTLYANLQEGLPAHSHDDAFSIVDQIRRDVQSAQSAQNGGASTGNGQ
jgi:PPM family protein phosphatase